MGSPLFALVLGAAIAQAAATTVVSTASEFDANMGQLDVVDVVSIELAADLACVSPVSIGAKKQLTISSPSEDEIYSLSSCGSAGLFTVTGQAALTLANVAISGEMNTTISVANEASAALDGVAETGRRISGTPTSGAVFFIVGFSTVVIDGGTFSKNTAVISGVAHVKRGSLLIRGGEFRDNYGDEARRRRLRGEGSELLVTGGTFANNFALEGGVFFVYEGSLNVSGGVFEGNAAAEGGVAKSQNRLVVSGGVFSNNGAEETGGVFHAGDDVAFVEGGSLYGSFDWSGGAFHNNSAPLGGVLYHAMSTAPRLLSGTVKMGFVDGVATWEAGEPLQLYGHPGGSLEVVASLESTWVAYAGAAFDEDRAQPYTANLTFTFRHALAGFVCEDFGQTLDAVVTKGGRYRASPRAEKTYECPGARRACPRGNATGAASCASGYAGARCGSCDRDHYRAMTRDGGMTCEKCRSGNNGVIVAVYAVVAVLALGALVAVVFSTTGSSLFLAVADTAGGAAEEVVGWASNAALQKRDSNRFALDDAATTSSLSVYVTKVKVVLNFVQIVSAVPMTPKEVVERRRIVTQVCLLFIHLTLPICAYAAVSALVSEEIDYGDGETRRFLRVEPAVATASSQYRSVTRRFERVLHPTHAVAADVAGATKRRTEHAMLSLDYQLRLVQRRNKSLEHDAANIVQSFQFLWIDYEPRWYLWEIFEVLRRLFFTTLLAIIAPDSKLQAFLALAVSVLFTAGYIHAQPFMEDDDDLLAEVSGWSVTILLFTTVMLRNGVLLGWIAVVLLLRRRPAHRGFFVIHRVFNGKYDEAIDDAEAACVDGRRGISGSAGGEADVELLDGHGPDEPNKDCSSAPTELLEMITCSANLEEKRGGEPEEGCDVGRSS
ncbi:alpha-ketoglutarate-dependent dioxygenase alkB-like protein [Aureococcus anophagefferens]|nr:alpha-ketoglutarate-dependent dioxygenase alkB-like protein [Aureococcus anophagefferens]